MTNPTNRSIPNGRTTPAVLLSMMAKQTLPCFGNAKRLYLFCLMMQKHCWNYLAFNQSYWRQNSSSSSFASWGKIKTHGFMCADQDWLGLMIFKNFADQDWIGFNFIRSELDSDWKITVRSSLTTGRLQRWPESLYQTPTPLLLKIFESGSGSFSNLLIRHLFRRRLQSSIQPKFTHVFT